MSESKRKMTKRLINCREVNGEEWERIVVSRIMSHYEVIDAFWKNIDNLLLKKTTGSHIPGFENSPVLYKTAIHHSGMTAFPFIFTKDLKIYYVKGGIHEMLKTVFCNDIEIGDYKVIPNKVYYGHPVLYLKFLPKDCKETMIMSVRKEDLMALAEGKTPQRIKKYAKARINLWERNSQKKI